jgi:hypothetical protein
MCRSFFSLLAVCLITTLCFAQAPPPASVCEVHLNKIKPGMTAQYEQGRAKHMAWHKAQNDKWSWDVWEVTTGENTGSYLITSCGHDWKDFDTRDKFNTADSANANATMGAYMASESMSYFVLRPDLGATPSSAGPPPAYLSVTYFNLKPEGVLDFYDAVKKIGPVVSKSVPGPRPAHWYSLANGGRGPEVALVQERKSMAEMAAPAKTLDVRMQEAYADQGAATMMALRKAYYSTNSELLHFRPDLSYMAPAAPK